VKRELELFQKLTTQLLHKEIEEPVIKPLQANSLWNKINISLEEEAISEEEFEKVLSKIIQAKKVHVETHHFPMAYDNEENAPCGIPLKQSEDPY
jgi:AAA+ superfamily predicted ATPase